MGTISNLSAMKNQNNSGIREQVEESVTENHEKGRKIKLQYFAKKSKEYLTGNISPAGLWFLMIYLTVISVLEVLAYLYCGIWSAAASRIWLIGGALCLVTILIYFTRAVIRDFREGKFFAAASILLLTVLLIYICGNQEISEINPDAAQQAAAGLDSFHSFDLNYTGKAFLGYPNRQYILAALPALLSGRSIFTLHMGFAFPFILGILILYCAFRKWAEGQKVNTNLAVLPLYALFAFPFITEYYANFEQAIYPVAFSMISIGFFLLFLYRPNILNALCLAWSGCLLSNSYTPALAALGLLIVFMALSAYQWLRKPGAMTFSVPAPFIAAKAFLLAEGNIIIFFAATLLSKRQDRITQLRDGNQLLKLACHSILDFLNDKDAVFLGTMGIIVLLYLFAGLTLRLKFHDFLLSLWVLGVFAASYLLKGYTDYESAWIKQRAMIVIPVVLTAVTLTVFRFLNKNKIKLGTGAAAVLLITFTFIGMNNFMKPNQSFTYFNYVQPMKYLWQDLEATVKENGLKATSKFNLIVYTDNVLMKNPADYCKFFYPNANIYVPEIGELPEDIDLSEATFLYSENALEDIVPGNTSYSTVPYINKKHEVSGTWYKGSILSE